MTIIRVFVHLCNSFRLPSILNLQSSEPIKYLLHIDGVFVTLCVVCGKYPISTKTMLDHKKKPTISPIPQVHHIKGCCILFKSIYLINDTCATWLLPTNEQSTVASIVDSMHLHDALVLVLTIILLFRIHRFHHYFALTLPLGGSSAYPLHYYSMVLRALSLFCICQVHCCGCINTELVCTSCIG